MFITGHSEPNLIEDVTGQLSITSMGSKGNERGYAVLMAPLDC